jgi:general secretion pathway protein D
MTSRLARSLLVTLLAAAAPVMPAQQTPPAPAGPSGAPPPQAGDELVSFKLPDNDIDSVLSLLEIYTGKIILRPAALPTATYNLKIDKKIPKSEAIVYIQTILSMNRIGVTPLGNNALKVVDLGITRTEAPEMISGSAFAQPASGKIATKIFQLEFMRVAEFATMVQSMLNPQLQGLVQLPAANAAIITDTVSNLQRIEVLIRELDRPMGGMKPKFYSLKSAKASDILTKIRAIIQGPLQQQLGTATTFSADDRTNQLVVITDPRQLEFFDELVDRLDGKADPNTRTEVIYLKHADAPEVQTLVTQVITGQTNAAQKTSGQSIRPGQVNVIPGGQPTPAAPAAPVAAAPAAANVTGDTGGSGANEFSALASVVADKRSNAIVISGTVDDIRLVTSLIDKLDTILAQVRLEVVICEVTLSDNASSGISQLGLIVSGDKVTGFSGTVPGATVTNGVITRSTVAAPVRGGFDLAATLAIEATPRKSNTSILSVPSITTTHNKDAKFFFGETRPIVSGVTSTPSTNGNSTSSQVQQQEIGTTITVKPLIGNDGSVQLDIKMEISEVGDKVLVDNNTQYVIGKRTANSYTTAKSGEILVLGGMQRRKTGKSTNRLGPIPIIGDLLGARTREDQRTDLLFFLRPIVLTNTAADNAEALKRVNGFEPNQKDPLKEKLDPNYVPPKKTVIDKMLGK